MSKDKVEKIEESLDQMQSKQDWFARICGGVVVMCILAVILAITIRLVLWAIGII